MGIGPGERILEACAPIQLAGIPVEPVPGQRRVREMPQEPEAVAVLVDPCPESRPLAQERLVGDLHRRAVRDRIAVEGEEALAAEGVDHVLDRGGAATELLDLLPSHAAARVVAPFAERDEAREQLPRRVPACDVELLVELFRPTGERPRDALRSACTPRP